MRKNKNLAVVIASLFLATLWGCGSNLDSGGDQTGPGTTIADATHVGSDSCKVCHTLAHTAIVSPLVGPLANGETALNIGHDCEACHGGGQFHKGVGPIPTPKPDLATCNNCHENKIAEVLTTAHVEGDVPKCAACHTSLNTAKAIENSCSNCHNTIATKVNGGKHSVGTTDHSGTCGRCHSLEGYLAFEAGTENYGTVSTTAYPGEINVSCAACHDPHTATLRVPRDWNVGSAQYNLCTSCHNLTNAAGTPIASGLDVGPVGLTVATSPMQQHSKDWYRNITTTHYDLPTTVVGTSATNVIEGYVIRKDSATACTDCHGHELRTDTNKAVGTATVPGVASSIHTQWAESGHAGALLKAKGAKFAELGYARTNATNQAVMTAGSLGAEYAWNHYPWSKTSKLDAAGATVDDRGSCQMCHTSTGFVNKIANPATYTPADNDFSHLAGWTAMVGSGQAELLYCWACHSSAETGALRASGVTTLDYTYSGKPVEIPAIGNSTTCVTCHAGRGNVADAAKPTRDGSVYHHAVAAATLFSSETHVGYEFDIDGDPATDNYANVAYFAHNTIGVATGEGPCAACHMDAANHKFEVVEKDASGVITGINATVCYSCHDGAHGPALVATDIVPGDGTAAAAAAFLEEESEGYQQAGAILIALSKNVIVNYLGYDMVAKWDHDTNAATATVYRFTTAPAGAYGAWQNSKLASDEPGAFAHNRIYAKRLIFDSIDLLEDGVINGSIANYSVTYPEGAIWLGAARP